MPSAPFVAPGFLSLISPPPHRIAFSRRPLPIGPGLTALTRPGADPQGRDNQSGNQGPIMHLPWRERMAYAQQRPERPPPNRKAVQVDIGRGMALRSCVGSMSDLTFAKRTALAPKAFRTRSGTSSESRLA